MPADHRREQPVVRRHENMLVRRSPATMSREVPTPGSTTATCTVPGGKYSNARASQNPASAGQWTTISCVRSMIRAVGRRPRMRPFMTPTKGP